MKKNNRIVNLLYLFVIITPFLDVIACLFRDWFPDASISPATILRPIIPLILLIYVFIKDKNIRKYLVIHGIVMILYGGIHLLIYKDLLTGISYGSVVSEAQYIINYTYMVYVLFLYIYFSSKGMLPKLNKVLYMMLVCYLGLLYIAILSGTSYTTYLEGMGYRGWFTSGNSLSTILILLMGSLITDMFKKRKISSFIVFSLLGIYLLFLVGTRTGLLGFILILSIYLFGSLGLKFIDKKKVSLKKVISVLSILLVIGIGVLVLGSSTIERRKHLEVENTGIIDVNTGEFGHTTGDTSTIVYQIKNNQVSEGYLSKEQRNAYLKMYEYANKNEIDSSNRRLQQLIYHINLLKEQHDIKYILLGNGYLSSYGEMVLEMELPAMIFNFGILGFILYIGPFIGMIISIIRKFIKEKKKIDIDTVMKGFCLLLALVLSCVAGYVFFSVSCVLVIICILSLLNKNGEVE